MLGTLSSQQGPAAGLIWRNDALNHAVTACLQCHAAEMALPQRRDQCAHGLCVRTPPQAERTRRLALNSHARAALYARHVLHSTTPATVWGKRSVVRAVC
jgi:hypothetical protein